MSKNISGPGKFNRFCLQIVSQDQITGSGAEADIVAGNIQVPCRCKINKIWASAHVMAAATTASIQLLKGTAVASHTDVHTAIALATATLAGSAAPTDPDAIYEEGDELCVSENSTNTKTVDGLQVTVEFVAIEA
jgi:hypothetical protein